MSVTKAEAVRINEKLQETIRILLRENKTLRTESEKLSAALTTSTRQIDVLSVRYQKLSDYTRRLHNWLSEWLKEHEALEPSNPLSANDKPR